VVAEVPNDAEALELARDLAPDVVVMQVQMPFSRAVETLKAMRAFPDPPKVVKTKNMSVRGLHRIYMW
jgi:DNA-binding NarL/FixJ family response regulator